MSRMPTRPESIGSTPGTLRRRLATLAMVVLAVCSVAAGASSPSLDALLTEADALRTSDPKQVDRLIGEIEKLVPSATPSQLVRVRMLRVHRAMTSGASETAVAELRQILTESNEAPTRFQAASMLANTQAILRNFEEFPSLESATVMVQAEVADRICALPGSKIYGAYTAKLALWACPAGRFEVGPGNFMPPPHVDSAVVRLDRGGVPLPEGLSRAEVAIAIDAAFAQRRKTIRNSMSSNGFDKEALDEAFAATGIAPNARAETLAPADFVRLAAALRK